ncbi:hypothetical protein [Sphingomonas oryzagri]
MRSLIFAALTAISIPGAAFAYPEGTGDHVATTDPGKVICRSQEVVGSRLATEKTCHTAAEWAQYEREMRLTTDRIQMQKSHQGG